MAKALNKLFLVASNTNNQNSWHVVFNFHVQHDSATTRACVWDDKTLRIKRKDRWYHYSLIEPQFCGQKNINTIVPLALLLNTLLNTADEDRTGALYLAMLLSLAFPNIRFDCFTQNINVINNSSLVFHIIPD